MSHRITALTTSLCLAFLFSPADASAEPASLDPDCVIRLAETADGSTTLEEVRQQCAVSAADLAISEPEEGDNWDGPVGFIHQVIYDNYLSNHEEPEDIDFYMCGPPMMNDAVQKMLYNLGVPDENVLFDDFGS